MVTIEELDNWKAMMVLLRLRQADRDEASAQMHAWDMDNIEKLAATMQQTPYAFCAVRDREPVMVFGATPYSANGVIGWSLATDRYKRVMPAVTRFCLGPMRTQLCRDGYTWLEARALENNAEALAWLERLGVNPVTPLKSYGKNGETFVLCRRIEDVHRA